MKQTDTDKQLRELIKKELPAERRDPWFIRKTMNRLPHKPAPVFSRWERLAYLLSGLLLAVLWAVTAFNLINSPVLTVSSLLQPVLLTLMSLALMAAIAVPYLKRS